jgi:hypothetical protein
MIKHLRRRIRENSELKSEYTNTYVLVYVHVNVNIENNSYMTRDRVACHIRPITCDNWCLSFYLVQVVEGYSKTFILLIDCFRKR